ncbi:EamA-like transporter family protein [compost metagenome]
MTEHVGTWAQTTELLLRPEVLLALLVSIGPTSAFAFWIQTVCQNYTSPARVAVIYAMEPVFAAITGVLFAGERLGWSALLGCGFIFTGMILAELKAGQSPDQGKCATSPASQ